MKACKKGVLGDMIGRPVVWEVRLCSMCLSKKGTRGVWLKPHELGEEEV